MLRDRARYDLGYRSTVLEDIEREGIDDRLVLLRGPRRAGKSVVLKDTASALCGRADVDPRQVIYLPADGMSAKDLTRGIVLGRDLTRSVDSARPLPRVWLLDEITGIDGWTQTLKYQRDNTAFGDDCVVCTGSSWSDTGDVERDLLVGPAPPAASPDALPRCPRRYPAGAATPHTGGPMGVTHPVWAVPAPVVALLLG